MTISPVFAMNNKKQLASSNSSFVCPDHEKGKIILKAKTDMLQAFARRKKPKKFGFFKKTKVIAAQNQNIEAVNYDKDLYKYLKKKYKKLNTKRVRKSFISRVKQNGLKTRTLNKTKLARRSKIRALRKTYGIERIYTIKVKEKNCKSFMNLIAKLNADPSIEYAEAAPLIEPTVDLNDPELIKTGETLDLNKLWGISRINAQAAWDIASGEGSVVAINDTGVDYNHPDLWANIWVNPNIIGDRNNDGQINLDDADLDDNHYISPNEIVPYMFGYNFGDNNSNPMDTHSHGTHVAGIASAVGNNAIGVAGVAYKAKILPLKGFGNYSTDLAGGIDYVTQLYQEGVLDSVVINNSWGRTGDGYSLSFKDVFDYAYEAGVINVNAAGNSFGRSILRGYSFHSKMIVVGNSAIDDKRSSSSSYGTMVDVVAPGTSTLSTVPGNNYGYKTGTSMASPHVTGLVALILENHPEYTIEDIRSILRSTSDSTLFTKFDRGVVDAAAAVNTTNVYPLAYIRAQQNPDLKIQQITGVADDRQDFQKYTLEFAKGIHYRDDAVDDWNLFYESTDPAVNDILLDNIADYELPAEDITVRLSVYDNSGQVSTDLMYFDGTRIEGANNVIINSPLRNDVLRAGKDIIIRGSVPAGFSVRLEYGYGHKPTTWVSEGVVVNSELIGGGEDIEIASIPSKFISLDSFLNLKLNFTKDNYSKTTLIEMVYVDSLLKAGWPQHLSPSGSRGGTFSHPKVFDIDNDGYKEILVLYNFTDTALDKDPSKLVVYNYDGSIKWQRSLLNREGRTANSSEAGQGIVVGDMDGDGLAEIFMITEFDNDAGGSVLRAFDHTGVAIDSLDDKYIFFGEFYSMLVDVDQDGEKELLIRTLTGSSNSQTAISILKKNGEQQIIGFGSRRIGLRSQNAFGVGQFDEDPELEIVASYQETSLIAFNLDGSILPGWPKHVSGQVNNKITTVDFDRDGLDEIVFTSSLAVIDSNLKDATEAQIGILDASANYLPGWPYKLYSGTSNYAGAFSSPSIGNLDDDDDLEISLGCYRCDHQHYVFNHDGTVLPGWPLDLDEGSIAGMDSTSNAIADINGDGKQDIIMQLGSISVRTITDGDFARTGGLTAYNSTGHPIDLNPHPDMFALPLDANYGYGRGVSGSLHTRAYTPIITDLDANSKIDIVLFTEHLVQARAGSFSDGEKEISKNRHGLYVWEFDVPFNSNLADWTQFAGNAEGVGRYLVEIDSNPDPDPDPDPSPPPPVDTKGNYADMSLSLEPVIAIDPKAELSYIKPGENIVVSVIAENKSSLREGKTAYGVSFSSPLHSNLEYIQNPHSDACSLSEDNSKVNCYWSYIPAASKKRETLIFKPKNSSSSIFAFGAGSKLETLNDIEGLEVEDPDLGNNSHSELYWLIKD